MVSRKQNLVIDQGSSIHFAFQLYDPSGDELVDSGGYTAQADLRQTLESNTIYTFDTSVASGMVHLDMTPAYSATIEPDNYYFTVELGVANTVNRIVEGMAVVRPTYVLTSSNVHDADPIETPLPNTVPTSTGDAPNDGYLYARQDGQWVRVPSGFSMMFEYVFDNVALPPPNNSQLRLNDINPIFATRIWLHNNNADSVDVSNLLSIVEANYVIFVQDKDDPTKRERFVTTGPITNFGTFCEIPVEWKSGQGFLVDNQRLIVVVYGGVIP
jgi:hypothetical protein